jgi:hypothetical protein
MRDIGFACGHFGRARQGAYLMETHWPALKDTLPSGKLRGRRERRRSDTLRKTQRIKSARERAHCAHRKGLWTDITPLSRRLPRCVAIGCIQGSSVSPGTHCIREPSRSACVPHCIDRGSAMVMARQCKKKSEMKWLIMGMGRT